MKIDGIAIASRIYDEISHTVETLKQEGITPCLGILQCEGEGASSVYVRNKMKAAEKIGIRVEIFSYTPNASQGELKKKIDEWNSDPAIHGIIVQLPLPRAYNQEEILNQIKHEKDIDLLGAASLGLLVQKQSLLMPPTADAVRECIGAAGVSLKGATAVMIGEGVFGRQIGLTLLNEGATVIFAHEYTQDLSSLTVEAHIIVSAVGKRSLLTADMVSTNAVVIDVGISVDEEGKIHGDCDPEVYEKVTAYTPVPGGVGPVTVACLLRNVVKAASSSHIIQP